MAKPFVLDISTSTTASSTTLPTGFHVLSVKNLDTAINIEVSFTEAIDTDSAGKATLTPTEDTLDFNNINQIMEADVIYHESASGTPSIRIQGFIA